MQKNFSFTPPRFKLIGHRGISSLAPENTIAGFKLAKQLGLNWIECDLQLTQDLEWVVFHDDILNRTSNGYGQIHDYNLNDIQKLDAGSWFHPKFKNEKIPTLKEIIFLLDKLKLIANLEIKIAKNSPFSPEFLAEHLRQTLSIHWPQKKPLPLISSFEHAALFYFKKNSPQFPLGFLFEELTLQTLKPIQNFNNISIHFHADQSTNINFIQSLTKQFPLIPYTINTLRLGQQLFEAGCFAIFSDYPQKFIPNTISSTLLNKYVSI